MLAVVDHQCKDHEDSPHPQSWTAKSVKVVETASVVIGLPAQSQRNAGGAKGGKSVKIATGARRRRSEPAAAPKSPRDSISLTNWTSLVFTAKGVS
jgi:hypothetical protein